MKKTSTPALCADVVAALRSAQITDRGSTVAVALPADMDANSYREAKLVLERLEGQYVTGRREFVFDHDPSHTVLSMTLMPPAKPLDFYETPPDVAARLLDLLGVDETDDDSPLGMSVLEPSAGRGALLDLLCSRWKVKASDPNLHAVELGDVNAERLRRKGYSVHHGNFLEWEPGRTFDRIMMNPPFTAFGKQPTYIDHVYHAWGMLADSGVMCAIIPDLSGSNRYAKDGSIYNPQSKVGAFLTFLRQHALGYDPVPKGAFAKSGTNVATAIITLIA